MNVRTLLLPTIALSAVSAHAASFYGDFSTASNDYSNGWLYGTASSTSSAITPFQSYKQRAGVDNGVGRWSNVDEIALVPAVFYSTTQSSHGVTPGTAALHGGYDGTLAFASYLFSATVLYNVTFAFGDGDTGLVDDYVTYNGGTLYALTGTQGAYTQTFQISATAGSLLDFRLGTAGVPPNGFNNDTTPLSATITQAVPEPSSYAALGLGALGILRRRRRA